MWSLLERARLRAAQVPGQTRFHLSSVLSPALPADPRDRSARRSAATDDRDEARIPALEIRLRALLLQTGLSPSVVLLPPSVDGDRGEIWVGFGRAVLLQPGTPGELDTLAERGQQILSSLVQLLDPPDSESSFAPPPPRLFGALQFDAFARDANAGGSQHVAIDGRDPWQGLPQAQFVLPRWLVSLRDDRNIIQLVATADQLLSSQALQDELRTIETAMLAPDRHSGSPLGSLLGSPSASSNRSSDLGVVAISSDDAKPWRSLVTRALQHIAAGDLAKVVLARFQCIDRAVGQDFDWVSAVCLLRQQYPGCLRFVLPLVGLTGVTALFMGATPELLVERRELNVRCDALAGSRPRSAEVESAQSVAESLLHDEKERREHAFVVQSIRDHLIRHGAQIEPSVPQARILRNVVHLWTPLAGTLTQPVHILSLLRDLHPTPAVCGVPQAAAADFISQNEGWNRGFYAAPIGWFDAQGDGAFYVGIRSALLRNDRAWLFAGAGIVAGSDPDHELRETAAKLRPMLSALACEPAAQPRMSA